MARPVFQRDFTDDAGNLLTGSVTVQLRREDDATLPQLYSASTGGDALGNPATFSGGRVRCYPEVGGFFRVDVTAGAYALDPPLRDYAVGLAAGTDFDGSWANLGGKPTLFDGDYASLSGKPTLGDAAAKNTGTTAGTLAAGDDSRITGALQAGTEDQTVTGGARVTVKNLGNLSGATITPDPGDRPIQKITNNGAGSILPGTNEGQYTLVLINTTGAGSVTTTGWTLEGDSLDTTTTSKFVCSCIVTSDVKLMVIVKVA